MARLSPRRTEDEQELRARIIAGSQEVEDYRALAEILVGTAGREEEGMAVLEHALELPLPGAEKAAVAADIAWWLYQLYRPERAIAVARDALSLLGGESGTAHVLMARGLGETTLAHCLYSIDRRESDTHATRALEALERLLTEYPESENVGAATLHAAGVYVLQAEYAKAVPLYKRAMRSDPSPRNRLICLVEIGNALRFLGRYAEAEEHLREALALAGADRQALPRIHFELGKVHHFTNRVQEAISALQQALATLPLNPSLRADPNYVAEIRWELGDLYYDAKKYGEAISALREALPDMAAPYPYFDALISLGHCYLQTRQYPSALECYQEVVASAEASPDERAIAEKGLAQSRWELGDLSYKASQYQEALDLFQEALPHLPRPYPYFHALVSLGHCYLQTRQYPSARECYEEVVAAADASPDAKRGAEAGLARLPPLPPRRTH